MKNLTNRTKIVLTVLCYLGLKLSIYSCKDDDTPPNCGCESETRTTIPESANLVGKLFYKDNVDGTNYYDHHYWIIYIEENCTNCVHHMMVCNEDMLSEISNIPVFNDVGDSSDHHHYENGLGIKFSGDLKIICQDVIAPGDYTQERITLTSIEQQ
jgi:hypothetical protein